MFRKKLHLGFSRTHLFPSSGYRPALPSSTSKSSNPNFHSVAASPRFFVSTPGTSNSILDSPEPPPAAAVVVRSVIPVRKYSPDPYVDFRESMEEMYQSRRELREPTMKNGSSDEWEYLQELLLCYLALNPKRTHRFIIGAFTDLLLSSAGCSLPETLPIHAAGAAPAAKISV